ncbi:MAG: nitrous-oxide metabolic protein NosY [Calditrichia bacterium]
MTTLTKLLPYELQNVARNRWVILYGLFFWGITEVLFRLGDDSKVLLSLLNLIITIIPLMSITFGVIYLYGAREYIEMMLAQPIHRKTLFVGLYTGLTGPLVIGFFIGVLIPFLTHYTYSAQNISVLTLLILCGMMLTAIFVAISFLIALRFDDRLRGFGITLIVWLTLVILYDAMVLFITILMSNYPLENALIVLTALNPVDLARVLLLMEMDIAALMGYTGAIFHRFFGSIVGIGVSSALLILWFYIPYRLALKKFLAKDF